MLEYDPCSIMKVYVDGRVNFSVDGDPELGSHCGKEEYFYKGLLIKKYFKREKFIVAVWS